MKKLPLLAALLCVALVTTFSVAAAQEQPSTAALLANNDVDRLIAVATAELLSTHGIEATVHDRIPDGATCAVAFGAGADELIDEAGTGVMARALTGVDRWETAAMSDTAYRYITKQCD